MALSKPKRVYAGNVAHMTMGPRYGWTYPTLCGRGIGRDRPLPHGAIAPCPECLERMRVASALVFLGLAIHRFLHSRGSP